MPSRFHFLITVLKHIASLRPIFSSCTSMLRFAYNARETSAVIHFSLDPASGFDVICSSRFHPLRPPKWRLSEDTSRLLRAYAAVSQLSSANRKELFACRGAQLSNSVSAMNIALRLLTRESACAYVRAFLRHCAKHDLTLAIPVYHGSGPVARTVCLSRTCSSQESLML